MEEAELWLVKEGGARPALGMFCGATGQCRSVRGEQVYLGFLPLALDLASHASGFLKACIVKVQVMEYMLWSSGMGWQFLS